MIIVNKLPITYKNYVSGSID